MIHGFLPKEMALNILGENGILGIGPYPKPGEEDADLVNAGSVLLFFSIITHKILRFITNKFLYNIYIINILNNA